jgi:cytochrome c oxidase subunit I+III
LPGPGWTAFVAAAATAVVFGAMTVRLSALGVVAGAVAIAAYTRWWWTMDRAQPRELADAGRGARLPLYGNGSTSVGSWAMMVLLVADAAVIASFVFAYLFLWSTQPPLWPPEKSQLPTLPGAGITAAFVAGAYVMFEASDRLVRRGARGGAGLTLVVSAVLAAGALAAGWRWLDGMGIEPTRHSYGATTWALLGYAALHVAMGGVMAAWCLARLGAGMMDAWRCLTLRVCLLWWRFTTPAALLTLLLVAGFPHVAS